MTQRFAFSTSKTLLAVAIFTSMTTSHAEEPAEQHRDGGRRPAGCVDASAGEGRSSDAGRVQLGRVEGHRERAVPSGPARGSHRFSHVHDPYFIKLIYYYFVRSNLFARYL